MEDIKGCLSAAIDHVNNLERYNGWLIRCLKENHMYKELDEYDEYRRKIEDEPHVPFNTIYRVDERENHNEKDYLDDENVM